MWPEKEPIKYAVLSSRRSRALRLVFLSVTSVHSAPPSLSSQSPSRSGSPSLSLSFSFRFSCTTPLARYLYILYSPCLALGLRGSLPADRPRGWHCGSPDGPRPQTDTKRSATFVFVRLHLGATARRSNAETRSVRRASLRAETQAKSRTTG